MITHFYISRVNHPQTKTINELKETEYNNYKLCQDNQMAKVTMIVGPIEMMTLKSLKSTE